MTRPRLLLLGPGLAHLYLLSRLPRDIAVTLVSEGPGHLYSGMFPGVLAHEYAAGDATIDLITLAARTGAALETGGAQHINADSCHVELRDGRTVPYDVLSLNVGACLQGRSLPGVAQHAIAVKPFAAVLPKLIHAASPVLIAGGGVAAVEIALVLRREFRVEVVLVAGSRSLLQRDSSFARVLRAEVESAGVQLVEGPRVIGVESNVALLDDGSRLAAGALVWATGPAPPPVLTGSELLKTPEGFARVDDALQSRSHRNVFGAGDCVSIDQYPHLEKAGVFSMRQAPVLLRNVVHALRGETLSARYTAQLRPLQIVNVGDGRGVATWRGLTYSGSLVSHLKHLIDRRWIRDYPVTTSIP